MVGRGFRLLLLLKKAALGERRDEEMIDVA
jgi:hypothetical protein